MRFDTTSPTVVLGLLIAGTVLLLYGVRLVTDAMQQTADGQARRALMRLLRYPLASFGAGIAATTFMQSSSAMSTLLVGLVSSGLVPLTVAIEMLLGANIGSTLVVQLLALNITHYAPEILGLGAAVALLTRRTSYKRVGQAAFAFGLILLGLAILSAGSAPIAASPITAIVLQALSEAPLVLLLIGAVLAMAFTSSAASIGLVIVLASNGSLPPVASLTIMLGANIGTTLMALLSSLSQNSPVGKRLGLAHTGTKLIGALIFFLFLGQLAGLLAQVWSNPGLQVSMAHLGFNVALAVVFIPLSKPLARLIEHLLPDEQPARPYQLDLDALATPAVALGQATRVILRMADIVSEMLARSIHAFEDKGRSVPSSIDALEGQLDELEEAVKRYLTRLDDTELSKEQQRRKLALLYIMTDLEAIGDIIDKQIMHLAHSRVRDQIVFSQEGWADLLTYHQEVASALQQVIAALAAQDGSLAAEFLERKARIHQQRKKLHRRHLRRLNSGVSPSISSSSIHLDLLNAMSRVLSYASNMAHVIQGDLR